MSPAPQDSPRFGRVVTAMVTPFDDDGALDLAGRGRPGPLAGRARQRRARAQRLHRRELGAHRRREGGAVAGRGRGRDVPVIAGTGSNDTAHSVSMTARAARVRRRRRARGHAVLQPALADRHLRALPGRGRGGGRPPRRALRHPGPLRPAHRHRRPCSAWPARCRPSWRSRTPPPTRRPRRTWPPRCRRASRSTAATTS